MNEDVRCEVEAGVATITIARPHRLNAVDVTGVKRLTQIFEGVADESTVRAIVLTGAGTRAFSVGADLKEMAQNGSIDDTGRKARGVALFNSLLRLDKPTIAAINGFAVGLGCELALACDLRIAVPEASLSLPEARLALGSMFGSVALPLLIPGAIAANMLFTGQPMSMREADRWGLVNEIVPQSQLLARATAIAHECLASAPLSLARYKQVWRLSQRIPLSEAIELDGEPDPYVSEDRHEGLAAYAEGRAPRWLGR